MFDPDQHAITIIDLPAFDEVKRKAKRPERPPTYRDAAPPCMGCRLTHYCAARGCSCPQFDSWTENGRINGKLKRIPQ